LLAVHQVVNGMVVVAVLVVIVVQFQVNHQEAVLVQNHHKH
jgi:hypothetical protein